MMFAQQLADRAQEAEKLLVPVPAITSTRMFLSASSFANASHSPRLTCEFRIFSGPALRMNIRTTPLSPRSISQWSLILYMAAPSGEF